MFLSICDEGEDEELLTSDGSGNQNLGFLHILISIWFYQNKLEMKNNSVNKIIFIIYFGNDVWNGFILAQILQIQPSDCQNQIQYRTLWGKGVLEPTNCFDPDNLDQVWGPIQQT